MVNSIEKAIEMLTVAHNQELTDMSEDHQKVVRNLTNEYEEEILLLKEEVAAYKNKLHILSLSYQ